MQEEVPRIRPAFESFTRLVKGLDTIFYREIIKFLLPSLLFRLLLSIQKERIADSHCIINFFFYIKYDTICAFLYPLVFVSNYTTANVLLLTLYQF